MNIPATISRIDDRLVIKLPLTSPTGKIRVKRKCESSNFGTPVATRQSCFAKNDYVEWQISYATKDPPESSRVGNITVNQRIGFELTKLLCEGARLNILADADLDELERFISSVQDTETLEENEEILRQDKCRKVKGGFRKFEEKIPLFIKNNQEKGYFVEIILKHKQRAVGLQSMVYLCFYIDRLKDKDGNSLLGKTAEAREFGELEMTSENKEFVTDVVKAFAIASQQHKKDISNILEQIRRKCTE